MKTELENNNRYFCFAEYCSHQFFSGWWLYERETNDGQPNADGYWGWLQDRDSSSPQQKLNDLCRRMGHDPPLLTRYTQKFAEWFAATFPNGLQVVKKNWKYELVEVVAKRPRQRRGGIRTIKGAAMADRARRRRELVNEE